MMDSNEIFNLIDVRSIQEYMAGHIPGAISIPYPQLPYRHSELDHESATVLYCHTDKTSYLAARLLSRLDFKDLYILINGFTGWEYAVELSDGSKVI